MPVENSTRCFDAHGSNQFARRAERDGFAVIHDGHTVAEPFGFIHVVGGEQDGAAGAAEFLDEVPELAAGLGIEAGGGFIEEDHLRIPHQGAGEREALLLAAGEIAHPRAGFLFEFHQADDFLRRGAALEEAAEERDRFADRKFFGKLRLLKLDAEALAKFGRIVAPVEAQQFDLARIGVVEALADFDGRGFAGAVGPEESEAFGGMDFEIQAIDGNDIFVCLSQAADPQERPWQGA